MVVKVDGQRIKYIEDVSRRAFEKIGPRERITNVSNEKICLNPKAKCYVTGKRLFGRKCIVVDCVFEVPIDMFTSRYYFEPKQYTVWCLRK